MKTAFGEIVPQIHIHIHRIIEGVRTKNIEATLGFLYFFMELDYKHGENMDQILQAFGLSKETVSKTMMLFKNMESMLSISDIDTTFFHISMTKYSSTIAVFKEIYSRKRH